MKLPVFSFFSSKPFLIRVFSLLFFLAFTGSKTLFAKIENPVTWTHSIEVKNSKTILLHFDAEIEDGWYIYSSKIEALGPIPTSIFLTESEKYSPSGDLEESPKPKTKYSDVFEMEIASFSKKARFSQKIERKTSEAFEIKVSLEFGVCNAKKCLPPELIDVVFSIPAASEIGDEKRAKKTNAFISPPKKETSNTSSVEKKENKKEKASSPKKKKKRKTLWAIFIAGFLGGLLALLTPCVFPMLPLTISYFTKQAKNTFYPIIYGVSIVVIYVFLGLLITILFGADALNSLASNGIVNFIFFVVFIIFALSFLGLFEITLPSKWVNKTDKNSNRGGLIGVFFMALTLGLVSFSCTGPIIGTLLVEASVLGERTGPLVGMLGFSVALALPFTLLSYFPKALQALPKSGGWLQTVKIVLGFLEIALALKFLSNVDLAYHWQFLDREVFLVLWIATGTFLTLFLAGMLRIEKTPPLSEGVGVFRICFAIISLAFTIYLLPGLWGAPLKAVSGFLPPEQTQDFNIHTIGASSHLESSKENKKEKKFGEFFKCPHGLNCFFDYEEALEAAKEENKPLFIDFTGWTCVNCRKMEAQVWSDEKVHSLLAEEFIVASLYVDDKTLLPESEVYVSEKTQKTIKTIGQKWADFQITRFESNSQPYYIIFSHEEEMLEEPHAYNTNIEEYVQFLKNGISNFKNKKPLPNLQ